MMRRETSEITNSVLKCGRKGSHEVGSVQSALFIIFILETTAFSFTGTKTHSLMLDSLNRRCCRGKLLILAFYIIRLGIPRKRPPRRTSQMAVISQLFGTV